MARDSGYPNNAAGNIAVDFVWGNFPMQPDDDRSGDGNATVVVAADAAQNVDWSGYSVKQSPALTKTDITVTLSPGLTSVVGNNHSVALNNWNGFPDYTPVSPYLDTVDQAALPNVVGLTESAAQTALEAIGFFKGVVTTTNVGATTVNDGLVKTQALAAGTVVNLGTQLAFVKFAAPTVPNLVGMTQSAASAALVAVGLTLGTVTDDTVGATSENNDTVKSQSVAAGQKANTGSAVNIVLFDFQG